MPKQKGGKKTQQRALHQREKGQKKEGERSIKKNH